MRERERRSLWESEGEICVYVCVREREFVRERKRESKFVREREREGEGEFVCVCVCVREWKKEREREFVKERKFVRERRGKFVYPRARVSVCVCVCVCVCVWERERERERESIAEEGKYLWMEEEMSWSTTRRRKLISSRKQRFGLLVGDVGVVVDGGGEECDSNGIQWPCFFWNCGAEVVPLRKITRIREWLPQSRSTKRCLLCYGALRGKSKADNDKASHLQSKNGKKRDNR